MNESTEFKGARELYPSTSSACEGLLDMVDYKLSPSRPQNLPWEEAVVVYKKWNEAFLEAYGDDQIQSVIDDLHKELKKYYGNYSSELFDRLDIYRQADGAAIIANQGELFPEEEECRKFNERLDKVIQVKAMLALLDDAKRQEYSEQRAEEGPDFSAGDEEQVESALEAENLLEDK